MNDSSHNEQAPVGTPETAPIQEVDAMNIEEPTPDNGAESAIEESKTATLEECTSSTEKIQQPQTTTEPSLSEYVEEPDEDLSDSEEEDESNGMVDADEDLENTSPAVQNETSPESHQSKLHRYEHADDDEDEDEEQNPESSIGLTENTRLKQYQWMGFNWLRENYLQKKSCILADDMGLGKTIQTLSLLSWIKMNSKKRVQFLIIVPLSTLENWGKEAEKFTHLKYILFHGNKERIAQLKNDMKKNKHDMVVTTYEIFRKFYTSVSQIKWEVTVYDEGHRLKSYASGNDPNAYDRHRKMKMSRVAERARQLHCVFKLILSGTPLQNSPMELWSLLNLLNPKTFTLDTRQAYTELNHENFRTIQTDIEPYILRRTKNIMNASGKLPPKTEKIIRVDLTLVQKTLYRAVLERNSSFLLKQFKSIPALNILQKNLLRICMHPYLLNHDSSVEHYVKEKNPDKSDEDLLVESSSKLIIVDKLLKHIIEEKKEKVLIFCTMLKTLDLLEDYLEHRNYEYRRFDGGTPGEKRFKMIEEFQKDDSIPVFLLSSKAGGIGINLTAANHVILYNSDYNPTTETQALSRAHRIGQEKEVKIYRLVCRQTVEEGILQVASRRQGVHELMLDGGDNGPKNKKLSNDEIEDILKCGVQEQLTTDSIDNCGDKLLNVGLEEILDNAITVSSAVDVRKKYFADSGGTGDAEQPKEDDSKQESDSFWSNLFPDYVDVEILKGRCDSTETFDEQSYQKFFNDLRQVQKELDESSEPDDSKNLDGLVSIKSKSEKNVDMHRVHLRMRNDLHALVLQVQRELSKKFPHVTPKDRELLGTLVSKFNERTLRSRKRKRYNDAEDIGETSSKRKKISERDPTFIPPPQPQKPTKITKRRKPPVNHDSGAQGTAMAGDHRMGIVGIMSNNAPRRLTGDLYTQPGFTPPAGAWKSGPLLRPASVYDVVHRDFSKSLISLCPAESFRRAQSSHQ